MTCSSGAQPAAAAAAIARSSSGEPSQRSSANGWSLQVLARPAGRRRRRCRARAGRPPGRARSAAAPPVSSTCRPRRRPAAPDRLAADDDPGRAPALDDDAVDERAADDPQPVAHRVEVGERGVPADAVDDVHRLGRDADRLVEVVRVRELRQPGRRARGVPRGLERRELGDRVRAHPLLRGGALEEREQLVRRPAGQAPAVVVARWPQVCTAPLWAEQPPSTRARSKPMPVAGEAPVVGGPELARVEEVRGPARIAERARVRAGLEHEHVDAGLGQPRGDDGARGPAADHHDVGLGGNISSEEVVVLALLPVGDRLEVAGHLRALERARSRRRRRRRDAAANTGSASSASSASMRLAGSAVRLVGVRPVGRRAGIQAAVDAVEPGHDLGRDREVRVRRGLGRAVLQVRRRRRRRRGPSRPCCPRPTGCGRARATSAGSACSR